MIIPSDQECRRILDELAEEPTLTDWERSFIEGNELRTTFTDKQKEVVAKFRDKFDV